MNAPYVNFSGIGNDPNDTATMMTRYATARAADYEPRKRCLRNMAGYLNDLIPEYLKAALFRDNRLEQNFNILMPIIRGHVGNVLMNWFDPKFNSREGDSIDAIEALYKVYLAQKERYDYKASAASCYENGYLSKGAEVLILDRPSSNPREWGLKFVNIRPDRITMDQNSDGDRISRNAQECWIDHWITPAQAIREYGLPGNGKEREILLKLQKDFRDAAVFDAPVTALYSSVDPKKIGSLMHAVEWMHIEHERLIKQYLKTGTPIPSSGYEIDTVEDILFKKDWAAQHGFELTEDMILTMVDWSPVMYTTVFAPELAILFDHRKDFRQLDGHVPVYTWSFIQKNGMHLGLWDYIYDIGQDFNKRELAKTKIITQTPIAGKSWLRRDMFDSDDEFKNACRDFTDSSKPLAIGENAPPAAQGFGILPGTNVPPSILQDETFKMRLNEFIGLLPPAMQGRSERSADTGVSIGRKVVEGNTMMRQESNSVIQHENDKHEDWVIVACKLFGNSIINMNRRFTFNKGKEEIVINEAVGIDAVGNTVMRNAIGSLTRVNVVISQAKENDFITQARLEKAVASLQAMPPSETNQLHRAAIEYAVVNSMDFSTDEDRELARRLSDKQLQIVEKNADLQIRTLDNQLKMPQGGPVPPGGQELPQPMAGMTA
jgi:hypothetical protein